MQISAVHTAKKKNINILFISASDINVYYGFVQVSAGHTVEQISLVWWMIANAAGKCKKKHR